MYKRKGCSCIIFVTDSIVLGEPAQPDKSEAGMRSCVGNLPAQEDNADRENLISHYAISVRMKRIKDIENVQLGCIR